MPANVCFWAFSVKCKENDSDKKYRLLGGQKICIFTQNFTDRIKLMILFHLKPPGARHYIPIFFNFWIIKFWKNIKKFFIENVTLFLFVLCFSYRKEIKNAKTTNVMVLAIQFLTKCLVYPLRSKTVGEDAFLVVKVKFFRGGEKHIIAWQY